MAGAAGPTDAELAAMLTMKEALTWADMEGDTADEASIAGSFLKLIGARATTKPRTLSTVKPADFQAILTSWRVPTGVGAETRAPTLVEIGEATLVLRACQLVGGKGQTLAEMQTYIAAEKAAPATPTSPAAAVNLRKVKMTVEQISRRRLT